MLDRNRMHDVLNAAGRVSCLFFRPCDAGACARCVRRVRFPSLVATLLSTLGFDASFSFSGAPCVLLAAFSSRYSLASM